MDTTLVVGLSLGLNASRKSSGVPKFSDVGEIGDFRQAKTENFSENKLLQLIWNCIFIFVQWIPGPLTLLYK